MNNKPTGMKLFFILMFLLCRTTVVAFIPVPDCDPLFDSGRSKGLRKVVDDWIAGGTTRDTVETTYGLIQDWDTSQVTSMYQLFYYQKRFDADLSKWNVANVIVMTQSTFQFPLFSSLSTTCSLFFLLLSPCASAQILIFLRSHNHNLQRIDSLHHTSNVFLFLS